MSQAKQNAQERAVVEQFRWDAARDFTSAIISTDGTGPIYAVQQGVRCADTLIRELQKTAPIIDD